MPIHWGVSQISQPVRILLIGAVVFLAAWFTVLQPEAGRSGAGDDDDHRLAATPDTGLGKAVDDAKKAAAQAADDAARTTPTTDPGTTATPAPTQGRRARRDRDPGRGARQASQGRRRRAEGPQGARARRVRRRRSRWRPMADDDRYVRNALQRDQPLRRQVVVKSVAIANLSTYGPLVNNLNVHQSPEPSSSSTATSRAGPHRLRRPHLDQPGDRRRPARQHRAEHQGRRTCVAQPALRRLRPPRRRAGRCRRSAASKADVASAAGSWRSTAVTAARSPAPRRRQVARAAEGLDHGPRSRRNARCGLAKAVKTGKLADLQARRLSTTKGDRQLDRRFERGRRHRLRRTTAGPRLGGRGPRALHRTPRRAQWARRRAFRGS